ncbi:MAG: hypothetical protein Ct9H300mP1_24200 [Planctomycetaceae bacterium]|nr:MAG: hypothetical protein Ct9H300mP1_24200 [Planctomycetaceae bacterium]
MTPQKGPKRPNRQTGDPGSRVNRKEYRSASFNSKQTPRVFRQLRKVGGPPGPCHPTVDGITKHPGQSENRKPSIGVPFLVLDLNSPTNRERVSRS